MQTITESTRLGGLPVALAAPRTGSLPGSSSYKVPIVLALLSISVFINYIDRGNLSVAASAIKDELGLSVSQLGILLSSFYWTYGLFQILAGWLVDRFKVGWVMAGGFFLWSVATSVTGMLHGFAALLLVRLVLGMGESVAYPSYSRIVAKYFASSRRGLANALVASGLACGPAFGMLLGGTLMSRFGWRSFFIAVGIISLVWLIPWIRWMPRGPGIATTDKAGYSPGTLEILKQRSAWGSFLGLFCNAYIIYFLIAWLPFYLVRERHFSMDAMAVIGGAVFLAQAISSTLSGLVSDRWIASGKSPSRVYKSLMVVALLACGIFLVTSALASTSLSIVLLVFVGVSIGLVMANIWPITQILAGPQASGRWTGLQCAFGNLSGAVASAVTGFIVQRTGHFVGSFAVAAGFAFLGVIAWLLIVGSIEPVPWGANIRRVVVGGVVAKSA